MTSTSPVSYDDKQWVWGTDDSRPRFLHAMIRVRDFDAMLRFYTEVIGMKQLGERFDVPARRVTAVFIGFDSYAAGGCLELVHRWDVEEPYTHGTGYGHISIGTPDMAATVARFDELRVEFTLRPTVLLEGGPQVAFIKDPEGYSIELVQTRRP
ncbi:MAG: VOC family protein [Lysobacterales bacterium]